VKYHNICYLPDGNICVASGHGLPVAGVYRQLSFTR